MCILNREYQVKQRVNIYKKTVTQSQKVQIKVFIFVQRSLQKLFHVQREIMSYFTMCVHVFFVQAAPLYHPLENL